MKKNGILIVLFLALSVVLSSCGGSGSASVSGNSPTKIVEKCYDLLMKKDYEKLAKMYVGEDGKKFTEEDIAKLKALLPMAVKEFEKKGGLNSYKVLSETLVDLEKSKHYGYNHEYAKVEVNQIFGNGEEEKERIYTIKIDGDWFISVMKPKIDF
ncbi:MAG: hypothetical protein AB7S72_17980 [Draconibacterium sp.]